MVEVFKRGMGRYNTPVNPDKCKAAVFGNWRHRQCSRKPRKDGWCKQHHPDSVAAREKESKLRWEEQRKRCPHCGRPYKEATPNAE